jgi:hypothetical protein
VRNYIHPFGLKIHLINAYEGMHGSKKTHVDGPHRHAIGMHGFKKAHIDGPFSIQKACII